MPSPSRYAQCILALTAAFLCTAAETIRDRDLKFSITVPDGFELAKGEMVVTDDLYHFFRAPSEASKTRTVIRISRLGGTLPSDFPMKDFTQAGVRFEVTPVKWKSHTIRKAKAGMELNGERIVVLIVQVPLKPEAISINVAGAESNQEELSTLLLGVLASLDGESNWVSENGESTTEEMKNAKKAITRDLYLCLLVPVAIVVAIYIRRQSRRDQAST